MKTIKYICTHCDRRFEAEEKEIVECPGCFWSTSVKKEEDYQDSNIQNGGGVASKNKSAGFKIKFNFFPFFVLIVVFLSFYLLYRSWPEVKTRLGSVVNQYQQIQSSKAEKKKEKVKKTESKDNSSLNAELKTPLDFLSPEDKSILTNHIQLSSDRALSDGEQKVLSFRAQFQTGSIENLPSKPWNFEAFKEMLTEQQKYYQITLPGSYRKKLEDGFRAKYLGAVDAFNQGNLLQARDLWVESLIFPIYGDNLQKHRGVVLTMIRPFINDTLSKIGAVSGTLTEQKIREKEIALNQHYNDLNSLITQKAWQEALAMVLTLQQDFSVLEKPDALTAQSAPYPASIKQVDADIQATLLEIQNPPSPATADIEPIRRDVDAKRRVIEGFIPQNIALAQSRHDEALKYIQEGNWIEAEKTLRQIESPLELLRDAQEKVKVLKKIQSQRIDSQVSTG